MFSHCCIMRPFYVVHRVYPCHVFSILYQFVLDIDCSAISELDLPVFYESHIFQGYLFVLYSIIFISLFIYLFIYLLQNVISFIFVTCCR